MDDVAHLLKLDAQSLEPAHLGVEHAGGVGSEVGTSNVDLVANLSAPVLGGRSVLNQHVKHFEVDLERDVLGEQAGQFSFCVQRVVSVQVLSEFGSPLSFQLASLGRDGLALHLNVDLRDHDGSTALIVGNREALSSAPVFEVAASVEVGLLVVVNRPRARNSDLYARSGNEELDVSAVQVRVALKVFSDSDVRTGRDREGANTVHVHSIERRSSYSQLLDLASSVRSGKVCVEVNVCERSSAVNSCNGSRELVQRETELTSAVESAFCQVTELSGASAVNGIASGERVFGVSVLEIQIENETSGKVHRLNAQEFLSCDLAEDLTNEGKSNASPLFAGAGGEGSAVCSGHATVSLRRLNYELLGLVFQHYGHIATVVVGQTFQKSGFLPLLSKSLRHSQLVLPRVGGLKQRLYEVCHFLGFCFCVFVICCRKPIVATCLLSGRNPLWVF